MTIYGEGFGAKEQLNSNREQKEENLPKNINIKLHRVKALAQYLPGRKEKMARLERKSGWKKKVQEDTVGLWGNDKRDFMTLFVHLLLHSPEQHVTKGWSRALVDL